MKTKCSTSHRPKAPDLTAFDRNKKRGRALPRILREPGRLSLKNIVVPLDFSKASLESLRYAVQLAAPYGSSICLVYVIERTSLNRNLENIPLILPEVELGQIARQRLLSIRQKEIGNTLPVTIRVSVGKPSWEIVTIAREIDADLIVIGSHGQSGLGRILLGSTAEQVIRRAPCPVLVLRERGKPAKTRKEAYEDHNL
jgi:nucleotide-binding universal stress UspA family protein